MSEITLVDDLDSQYTTYNFNTDPSHFLDPIDIAIETIMATRGYEKEVEVRATMQFGNEKPSFNFSTRGTIMDQKGNSADFEIKHRDDGITDVSLGAKHSDRDRESNRSR